MLEIVLETLTMAVLMSLVLIQIYSTQIHTDQY